MALRVRHKAILKELKDGSIYLNAVGNLTMDIPFLVQYNKVFATPFYLVEKNKTGVVQGIPKKFQDDKGCFSTLNLEKVEPKKKNLRIPSIAVNLSKTQYEKLSSNQNFASLKYAENEKGITVFIPFAIFDKSAIALHSETVKGDTIAVQGVLKLAEVFGKNTNTHEMIVFGENAEILKSKKMKEELKQNKN